MSVHFLRKKYIQLIFYNNQFRFILHFTKVDNKMNSSAPQQPYTGATNSQVPLKHQSIKKTSGFPVVKMQTCHTSTMEWNTGLSQTSVQKQNLESLPEGTLGQQQQHMGSVILPNEASLMQSVASNNGPSSSLVFSDPPGDHLQVRDLQKIENKKKQMI